MTTYQPSIKKPPLPPTPLISGIMPVHNEAHYIRQTLQSITGQTYPAAHMEVIIADGGSDDETRALVAEVQQQHPDYRIQLIDNPHRTYSAGFNKGLAHAQGEILVFLGGHTELCPTYFEQCARTLAETGADCVGGIVRTSGLTRTAQAIALALSSPFGMGGVSFRRVNQQAGLRTVDTVAYGAYRREVFAQLGSLDEELVRNQDDEFNYRLRKAGGRIVLNPAIFTEYYSRTSLRHLARQFFQYGYWKVRVMQKHPRQMRPRQFAPLTLVLSLLGPAILGLLSPVGWLLLAGVAVLYLGVDLAFAGWISRTEGFQYFPYLFVIFPTLHLSYGLGFLVGLFKFRQHWRKSANA